MMNFKKIIMMLGLFAVNVYGQDFVDVEEGQSDSHTLQMHLSQDDVSQIEQGEQDHKKNVCKIVQSLMIDGIYKILIDTYDYIVDNRDFIRAEIYSVSREIFIGVMVEKLSRAPENNPT